MKKSDDNVNSIDWCKNTPIGVESTRNGRIAHLAWTDRALNQFFRRFDQREKLLQLLTDAEWEQLLPSILKDSPEAQSGFRKLGVSMGKELIIRCGNIRDAVDALEEAIAEVTLGKLRECKAHQDTEMAHGVADEILVGFIRFLGYGEIADEYEAIQKWYA